MKTKSKLYLILVLLAFASCKKAIEKPEDENGTGNTVAYIKGNFDDAAFNWKVTDGQSVYASGTSLRTYIGTGISTGYFGASIAKIPITFSTSYVPSLTIEFGTTRVNFDENRYSYLKSFVTKGKWDFATIYEPVVGTKKVIINYKDKSGKGYYSVGAQTGTFEITDITLFPATMLGHEDGLKLKVNFSCKLYPEDGVGSAINITNGEASIIVESRIY